MSLSLFETGFYGRLRQDAGDVWHAYVDHAFLRQLAAGTLPETAFRCYLMQDYLFLVHFARAWGLLASKLDCLPDIRAATAGLNNIVAELPLHVGYCREWGLTESAMATETEASETLNYTRYVMDIGHSGDALDLLTVLMPCVAGYAEAGLRLLASPATVMTGNPYAAWMQNYSDNSYLDGVRAALALFERIAAERGGSARFSRLSTLFSTATRLESAFWQMGLNAAPAGGRSA